MEGSTSLLYLAGMHKGREPRKSLRSRAYAERTDGERTDGERTEVERTDGTDGGRWYDLSSRLSPSTESCCNDY